MSCIRFESHCRQRLQEEQEKAKEAMEAEKYALVVGTGFLAPVWFVPMHCASLPCHSMPHDLCAAGVCQPCLVTSACSVRCFTGCHCRNLSTSGPQSLCAPYRRPLPFTLSPMPPAACHPSMLHAMQRPLCSMPLCPVCICASCTAQFSRGQKGRLASPPPKTIS